ncbi:MAG: type II toxin-antitoxin system RelE/ParE family toxin, partial [Flavobacterium sp.]
MDLRILWTNAASRQLEEVFDYYKTTATLAVARKLVKGIVNKTRILSSNPGVGQKELL